MQWHFGIGAGGAYPGGTTTGIVGVVVLTLTMDAGAQTPRPNILYIMADDIGRGDFQCYNPQGKAPSPNIDRLARE